MRLFSLLAVLWLGVAMPASAQRYPQLVKTSKRYVVAAPTGYDIVGIACTPVPQTPSRTVNISPDASDPLRISSVVSNAAFCPFYDTSLSDLFTGKVTPADGYRDYLFDAFYGSLIDVRPYDIVCTGSVVLRGRRIWNSIRKEYEPCCGDGACASCYTQCFETMPPVTLRFDVYNLPPRITSFTAPTSATCPGSIFVHGEATDDDGGPVELRWERAGPNGEGTVPFLGTSDAQFTISRSGSWTIRLHVDDDEGERTTQSRTLTATPGKPSITIAGSASVPVKQPIQLSVRSPSEDCGTLTTTWDIVSAPRDASHAPQDGFATGTSMSLATQDERDIGQWTFRATSTIAGLSDSKTYTVDVSNLPPRIDIGSPTMQVIPVGAPIRLATSILADDDGGSLSFSWELVQAPASANVAVGPDFATGPSIDVPTSASSVGTWVFRLTATDNDNAPNSRVTSQAYEIVVDAKPVAAITGAPLVVPARSLVTLSSAGSIDPDTPCPGVFMGCHVALAGWMVRTSPGLVTYRWYVEPPVEYWSRIPPGRVSDAFGIPDSGPTLSIDRLDPGAWVFRLEVVDGEGNVASESIGIDVIEPNTPPTALLSPPARFLVPLSGSVSTPIGVSGQGSFDLDNLLSGPVVSSMSGLVVSSSGITRYHWNVTPPRGCFFWPQDFDGGSSVTLFPAGAAIPSRCQGAWSVALTVTDDDTPGLTDSTTTQVVIGNCPRAVCIDAPTTWVPRVVEAWERTDVPVVYHLDSALYDDPTFQSGMLTELAIFGPGNPATPVYVGLDPNVYLSSKGGLLTFHWNGYTNTGERVATGLYDVRVSLLAAGGTATSLTDIQLFSIWMEVAQVRLSAASTYVDHDAMVAGTPVHVSYEVPGAFSLDAVRWLVRDAAGSVVFDRTVPGTLTGSVQWDGRDTSGSFVAPGQYTFELEAMRSGQVLARSQRLSMMLYLLRLTPSAGGGAVPSSGLPLFVNSDDDDWSGRSDSLEGTGVVGEDDLIAVDVHVEPSALASMVRVASSLSPAPFRVWTQPTKAGELFLPDVLAGPGAAPPAQLFLEGVDPKQAELQAEFVLPAPLASIPGPRLKLNLVQIEAMSDNDNNHVIGLGDTPAFSLPISRWDNAYGPSPNFPVRNNASPDSFIDQDPRRFYLRVSDPAANRDPATVERIHLDLGTANGVSAVDDNPDRVTLVETGAATGVFVSTSQLIVTPDLPAAPDDAFAAHDGAVGVVADNAAGDRTHRGSIDGSVRFAYTAAGAVGAKPFSLPICARSPEARRKVQVRTRIFNEPFQDVGYDDDGNPATPPLNKTAGGFDYDDKNGNHVHDVGEPSEPYIDLSHGGTAMARGTDPGVDDGYGPVVTPAHALAQLERASVAWSPACIRFESVGVSTVDAPKVGATSASPGMDILADGFLNGNWDSAPNNLDVEAIYNAYSATMTTDVVDVFYTAPMVPRYLAVAIVPHYQPFTHGDLTFVVMTPNLDVRYRTLAHEFGHILGNEPDVPNDLPTFFPASTHSYLDDRENSFRRFPERIENSVRTVRPLGALNALGNTYLKAP